LQRQENYGHGAAWTERLLPYPGLDLMIPKPLEWARLFASSDERVLALHANQRSGFKALRDYNPRQWSF